jgi:signal transduction histidine kinase
MIRVSDQGTGIPEELRDRVFEPFFTTKNPGEGTGLGLPLVYSIIRDHAGSINIDSNPGDGTRMLIRLPLPRWTADQTVSGATPDHIV